MYILNKKSMHWIGTNSPRHGIGSLCIEYSLRDDLKHFYFRILKFWENYVRSMNTALQLTYSQTLFTYKRSDFILNFTIYFGSQFRLFIYLIFRIFRHTCSSQCCNVKKKRHEWHLIIHCLTVSLSKLRNTSVFFLKMI